MVRALVVWADPSSTNLGMRVLADGATALLKGAFPGADVVHQSSGHGPAPANIGVPRTLAREAVTNHRGLRTWLRGFDVVLDMRGGDSFTDSYGLRRLRRQSLFAALVRGLGIPLVLGPQTIGPFTTRAGHLLGATTVRHADLVLARDPLSAAVAGALGRVPEATATDVVFLLPPPADPASPGTHDVLLNVSGLLWDPHRPGHSTYRRTVHSLLTDLSRRGREMTLLAHVLDSRDTDNDVPVVRELAERYHLRALVPDGLEEARAQMAGARVVVGSRMHACLNALSVGTPAVPLAYSRKFAPLLADLGWSEVVDLRDPEAHERAADRADALVADDGAARLQELRSRAQDLLGVAADHLRGVL